MSFSKQHLRIEYARLREWVITMGTIIDLGSNINVKTLVGTAMKQILKEGD